MPFILEKKKNSEAGEPAEHERESGYVDDLGVLDLDLLWV